MLKILLLSLVILLSFNTPSRANSLASTSGGSKMESDAKYKFLDEFLYEEPVEDMAPEETYQPKPVPAPVKPPVDNTTNEHTLTDDL